VRANSAVNYRPEKDEIHSGVEQNKCCLSLNNNQIFYKKKETSIRFTIIFQKNLFKMPSVSGIEIFIIVIVK